MIESDTFTPFFGVVEDLNDPDKEGKLRVRIYGYNSADRSTLPTDYLKWFPTVVSNSAGISGLGSSPTGYLVGSFVFGFYIDKDKQDGIILGSITGIGDVTEIAKGVLGDYVDSLKSNRLTNVSDARGETWSEPETKYSPEYPNNKVFTTSSGHVVEFDDTPGHERIVVFHKSGTFEEFHPDGKKVNRYSNRSFDIHLGGHNIFVNGNLNLVASGDYRVSVGGEYYCKARNVVFDTETVDIYGVSSANDHLSSGVSGADHIHPGVQTGPGSTAPPSGKSSGFSPSPANNFFLELEDTGYTPELVEFAIKQGFMTEQEADEILNSEPIIDSIDETPNERTRVTLSECGIELSENGDVDYNVQLSQNFILRDVSIGAIVSQRPIIEQHNLSKSEIICNLKNICENILEPLNSKYPGMLITSAFRHGTKGSQHEKGEAVDIQFRNVTKNFYFEVAKWAKNNLPYDQFLLEYQSSGNPWLHFSLTRNRKQRYQVMTFFNHRKVQDGLVRLQ